MRTVVGVFPSRAEAEHVVKHLVEVGVPSDDITVADSVKADHREWSERNLAACGGLSAGWFMAWTIPLVAKRNVPGAAAFGGAIGAAAGVVAGFLALAARGGNPMYGSSLLTVLAPVAIGAFFGALIAGMYNKGVTHEEVPLQEEAVRENGVVVAAHVDAPRATHAFDIMSEHGARALREDIDAWKASGWTGTFVPDTPYPSDSTVCRHPVR